MNTSLSALLPIVSSLFSDRSCFAVDVGAHNGEFSKFLIQTGFFEKVIAFEPNIDSYLQMLDKVQEHDNCKFMGVNSALSSESGEFALFCDEDTATASLLQYDCSYITRGIIKKNTVSTLTLDEYFDKNIDLGRLLCLKIDTQGNDLSVIMGGNHTILKHRPIIQTEFIYTPLYLKQCSPDELSRALIQLNYKMYSLNNLHVTPEGRLAFCDAIFVPIELDIPRSQIYSCIDDQISFQTQIKTLAEICSERLDVINLLDAEVQRLHGI